MQFYAVVSWENLLVWLKNLIQFQLAVIPAKFFLVYEAFLGEEYGWRYYLQPLMQKRFGIRGGVLVLGVVWGIWHLPIAGSYSHLGAQERSLHLVCRLLLQ
ncbi:MAG: CPBP family intramembrane metalloprotease [Lachnospiraceae bacterium]|nr:CPBP family intramembrane metalloprotease [Lachnospiraceae bacterium]